MSIPSLRNRPSVSAIRTTYLILLIGLAATAAVAADPVLGDPDPQDMRMLRYPDIHGDTIVFTYAGNLWTVGVQGGEARRLTVSEGFQVQPSAGTPHTPLGAAG